MERAADYDEQSEVLFLFNEDADETQSQTDNPPHPMPPQPAPCPTTSEPTQPATTNLSADQSFWAEVYTLQPPHALMGVLTDLHVHRFVLHQHLDSLTPPLPKLPSAINPSLTHFHLLSSVSLPFTTTTYNERKTTHAWLSMPLTLWPAFHQRPTSRIPTSAHKPPHIHTHRPILYLVLSHLSDSIQSPLPLPGIPLCKMPPPKPSHLQFPSWPTHSNLYSSTNHSRPPLDHTHTTATFRRTSMPLFSFLLLPASCQHRKPTNRTPPFPPPAWLLPHHPTPHQPLTSNLTIDGNTSTSFPLPQLPCRNNHTHHRHFLPPSGHTAQPTLQDTSTRHHPHPHSAAGPTHRFPHSHIAQRQPPLHSSTMLQSTLFQNDPRHHFIKPNNLPPPLNRCSPSLRLLAGHVSKAASYTPTPSEAPPQTSAPPTHPWPAHYQVPTQQQPPLIPIQVSSAALAPPSPVVMLHPPTTGVDQQGRPLPQSQQDYDPRTDPWHADNH